MEPPSLDSVPDTSYGVSHSSAPDTSHRVLAGSTPLTSYGPSDDFGSAPDTSYKAPLYDSSDPDLTSYELPTYTTLNTSDVKPQVGQTLYAIVKVSGLPEDYGRHQLTHQSRAGSRLLTYTTVANPDGWNIKDALGYDQFTWHLLPKALIDEL
ncbi:hypothetical protein VCV18_007535 [Metarhizium anisopliae]